MKLGMYTPEMPGSLEEGFAKAKGFGFECAQFDFFTLAGETMPGFITDLEALRIEKASEAYGIHICAINGTFNMVHPDPKVREEGVDRFRSIAWAARTLRCPLVSLCTGTRSTQSMWTAHPDNGSEEAWVDLLRTTERLIVLAEHYGINLGVEVEASNVIDTPIRARRFLDMMASPRLKIIMDCANLFKPGTAKKSRVEGEIQKAFDLLGRDIALAHGKDIMETDEGLKFTSAGRGIVDFHLYLELLTSFGYTGPMILHGIKAQEEFEPAVRFMRERA